VVQLSLGVFEFAVRFTAFRFKVIEDLFLFMVMEALQLSNCLLVLGLPFLQQLGQLTQAILVLFLLMLQLVVLPHDMLVFTS
jgi:hypothetical protein